MAENNHLDPKIEQENRLKEIGASLERIRIAKNISLDTVAAETLISKRLLTAIETGDIKELPEPFYTRALVAKFARAIGAPEIELTITSQTSHTAVSQTSASSRNFLARYWINFQLRSLHLYLMYIVLVIISVRGITALVERPVIVNQISEPDVELPLEGVADTESTPKPTSQPESSPHLISQTKSSEGVTVGINLQDRCWLKVMVDGKPAFEGTLPKGTQRTWTGKEQVTIRAGNAGGVVITFNNGQKQILGAPGQVEEVTYTVNY